METLEQQLNADLNSVQELLLIEAKRTLSKTYSNEEIKNLDELKSLGFKNTKEQKAYEDWKKAQSITKYSETYPMNKFITDGAVKEICEKYGLLIANVGDYESDIPVYNQQVIINFRVIESDIKEEFQWPSISSLDFYNSFRSSWISEMYGINSILSSQKIELPKTKMVQAKNLKIIAPPAKLNMTNKKIVGHCLIDKDPIVLQPVKDGYLIVTAWGSEANDSQVQNPRHN